MIHLMDQLVDKDEATLIKEYISVCKISGNNPNNISKPLRKGGFVMLKQYKIRVRRRRDGELFLRSAETLNRVHACGRGAVAPRPHFQNKRKGSGIVSESMRRGIDRRCGV